MQVHLVDGTYELFRAHFGAPRATTRDGVEVGATRGLLRSLRALCKQPGVTHVAIAFDTVIESFRNQLFAGYKTGAGVEPELMAQFPLAERAARSLGLLTYSMIEFEADDALATAAARTALDPRVERVVIASPDKDLLQMVRGTRIVALDRRRELVLDQDAVVQKLGIVPESVPDWLALVGDAQDGIPGIARFGEKSASAVLRRYLHLEAIPDDANDWDVAVRGKEALAQNLAAARSESLLYRQLATLRTDVPIAAEVDDLVYRGPDRDALRALCAELEFDSFAERA
ncbi:MAG: 5'-3' exonuclease H3TH domain-containing protein [Planctomycetota bacterium]